MINPIGFSPVSFSSNNKPKRIIPLEEKSPERKAMKTSVLYSQIEALNKQITQLEEKCQKAVKMNPEFDNTAMLQNIGRLFNQKIILETQLQEEIAARLKANS